MKKKTEFLYKVVYEQIKRQITEGTWPANTKLPSERQLGEQFGASTITIKRALELLCNEGAIYRIQGRGTFVCHTQEPQAARPVKNKLIGMVLEHVSSPFGLTMTYRITQILNEAGYQLIVRFSFGHPNREAEEIEALLALGISGLIIMPCHDSYYSMAIVKLMLEHFPVVLVDKQMHGLPISSVCTDGCKAISNLVTHLHEAGCKRISLVTIDPHGTASLMDRIKGYKDGLLSIDQAPHQQILLPRRTADLNDTRNNDECTRIIGEQWDAMDIKPDGLICTEFPLARSLYEALQARGITFGEKTIRACCIDEDYEAVGGFTFTHMRQDEISIADRAVEILVRSLRGEQGEPEQIKVPAIFKLGKTTR